MDLSSGNAKIFKIIAPKRKEKYLRFDGVGIFLPKHLKNGERFGIIDKKGKIAGQK